MQNAPRQDDEVVLPTDHLLQVNLAIDLSSSMFLPARVSQIADGPGCFYIQLVGDPYTTALQNVRESLQNDYAGDVGNSYYIQTQHLVPNMYCAALYRQDNSWHRGKIVSLVDGCIRVYYIDYGTVGIVARNEIRYLKKTYMNIPSQAIPCRLANIRPPYMQRMWSEYSINRFFDLVVANVTRLYVQFEKQYLHPITMIPMYDVRLCDVTNKRLYINEALVYERLADFSADARIYMQNVFSVNFDSPPFDAVLPGEFITQVTIEMDSASSKFAPVYVSQVAAGASSFYVQLIGPGYSTALDNLMQSLESDYSGECGNYYYIRSHHLVQGLLCTALFRAENNWHRARIVAVFEETVQVMYIDFGTVNTVTWNEIRYLKRVYMTLPSQAIQCCLSNIRPSNMQPRWSELANTRFIHMVFENSPQMYVHFVEQRFLSETRELLYCVRLCNITRKFYVNDVLVQEGLAEYESDVRNRMYNPRSMAYIVPMQPQIHNVPITQPMFWAVQPTTNPEFGPTQRLLLVPQNMEGSNTSTIPPGCYSHYLPIQSPEHYNNSDLVCRSRVNMPIVVDPPVELIQHQPYNVEEEDRTAQREEANSSPKPFDVFDEMNRVIDYLDRTCGPDDSTDIAPMSMDSGETTDEIIDLCRILDSIPFPTEQSRFVHFE